MLDNIEEKRRFAQIMTMLADYYDKEVSKAKATMYWEGLKQYDLEAVEKAFKMHAASPDENSRWFPKIADLLKYIEGNTEDKAQLAWSKVDKAIRQVGTYTDVVFDDPIIHAVIVDMGGWYLLGEKDDEAWPFVAKEFVTRYRGYKQKTQQPEYPARLVGLANTYNASHGLPIAEPRLIGDVQKCKIILAFENKKDDPKQLN